MCVYADMQSMHISPILAHVCRDGALINTWRAEILNIMLECQYDNSYCLLKFKNRTHTHQSVQTQPEVKMGALLLISHPRSAIPAANLVQVHDFCISTEAYHTHTTKRKFVHTHLHCRLLIDSYTLMDSHTKNISRTHARQKPTAGEHELRAARVKQKKRGPHWRAARGLHLMRARPVREVQHWAGRQSRPERRAVMHIVRIFELNGFCRTRRDGKGKEEENVQTWRKGRTASEATMRLRMGARSWSIPLMCRTIRRVYSSKVVHSWAKNCKKMHKNFTPVAGLIF